MNESPFFSRFHLLDPGFKRKRIGALKSGTHNVDAQRSLRAKKTRALACCMLGKSTFNICRYAGIEPAQVRFD